MLVQDFFNSFTSFFLLAGDNYWWGLEEQAFDDLNFWQDLENNSLHWSIVDYDMGEYTTNNDHRRPIRDDFLNIPLEQPLQIFLWETANFFSEADEINKRVLWSVLRNTFYYPICLYSDLCQLEKQIMAIGGLVGILSWYDEKASLSVIG